MTATTKTVSFEELIGTVRKCRQAGKTVVHCHGVFDLLHIGHMRYLQAAKRRGDLLIVTVTPDRFVNKGPHRPVFEERLRTEALASLDCIDFVAINQWPTAVEALQRLQPTIYVKGAEFRERKTPEMLQEEAAAAALGVRVEFIEDDVTSSSSYLINHFLSPFSEEVDAYLTAVRQKWTASDLVERLAQARNLRVAVIGEAILDEYVFCSTLGQSTKSPNVVGRFQAQERYLGGALAVANHIAGFGADVQLITVLGNEPELRAEITNKLRPAVRPHFLTRDNAATIVKRQFRESYFSTILFELDYLDESPLPGVLRDQLRGLVQTLAGQVDLVVVADHGHGLLDGETIEALSKSARKLAVSTPASAANLGYHTISRYPRADFLVLAEQDLRLDRRSREGDVQEMLVELATRLKAQQALLTVGSKGAIGYSSQTGSVAAPALATRVVDRSGAAAAIFAATSLGAALDLPLEQLAFLSNVVGAQAVSVLGTSRFLDALAVRRAIESLLK